MPSVRILENGKEKTMYRLFISLLLIMTVFGCSEFATTQYVRASRTYELSAAGVREYERRIAPIKEIDTLPISDVEKLKQKCDAYGKIPHIQGASELRWLLKADEKKVCAEYRDAYRTAALDKRKRETAAFNKAHREKQQKIRSEKAAKRREAEAKKAALEATPQFALNKYCEAHCFVQQYKGFLAYQRKITSASGVIDKRAMYELGEGLVDWRETRDEWKVEYRNRTGKTPKPSQCECRE